MLPPGYQWRDANGLLTPGWCELVDEGGTTVALIQPHAGRFHIAVGLGGYAHAIRKGSAVTQDRATMHVERWAREQVGVRSPRASSAIEPPGSIFLAG